jgi:hypothetical protein
MLLSEPLLDEFAERFRGVNAKDVDSQAGAPDVHVGARASQEVI